MNRQWSLIGAPSSAGAHTPGVEQAPGALRAAGLLRSLDGVTDLGDIPGFRWRPDPSRPTAQNAPTVARVARDVAAAVAAVPGTPLVLGGDCTVTLGLVAGAGAPALVYVDGGPDLYTPQTRLNGNLDAMGLAHMLGLPGAAPEVAAVGGATPMLTPDRVVVYGDDLPVGDPERDLVDSLGLTYVPGSEVHADAAAAAGRARAAAEGAADHFVVHFDVDVLAFGAAPFADVPEPLGLSLDEAGTTLSILAASPRFAGLSITEVNPDHLPEPTDLQPLIAMLAKALQ
ncbi:arginase family protein [Actinoplanes nipponensis]|nr:arginase family protein [Actinoplanes nipponensis]